MGISNTKILFGELACAVALAGSWSLAGAETAAAAPPIVDGLPPAFGEFAAAVQSVSDEYGTPPIHISYEYLPQYPDAYAGTTQDGEIVVNSLNMSDPAEVQRSYDNDVALDFHPPGCSAQTGLGIHEAGHVLSLIKGDRPEDVAFQRFGGQDLTGLLSKYSYSFGGYIDTSEALPEALVAIKCEPATATWAERELYNILVNTP